MSSCKSNNYNNDNIKSFEKRKLIKKRKHEKILIGRNIDAFKKIYNAYNFKKSRYSVYFLYKETDCNTCIKRSFKMVDTLNTLLKNSSVKIISLNNNSTNKYSNNNIIDGSKIFNNQEVNFMLTPLIIVLDNKDFRVKHAYFSIFGINQKAEKKKFLNTVYSLFN